LNHAGDFPQDVLVLYTSHERFQLDVLEPLKVEKVAKEMGGTLAKRSNTEWLDDLRASGASQNGALEDLRAILVSGLPYALSKWLRPNDPKFDPLVEDVVQNSLLRILESLDTFEGRSKFTTWAHKITVRMALSELRRKRWMDYSLEEMVEGEDGSTLSIFPSDEIGPELATVQADMIKKVKILLEDELTEKQRAALIAIRIRGAPIAEVAERMGMTRNALYKLLHDGRLRLRARMLAEGLSPEEIISVFE
jgi:RNA polymerase sigma-70 factor, ECF subfamily